MDAIECYRMTLGVLNAEPNLHLVLADLLEEQGEHEWAALARRKKNNRGRRLDFALAVLPLDECLKLGCEFVIQYSGSQPQLKDCSERIGRWAMGMPTNLESVDRALRALADGFPGNIPQQLATATLVASRAMQYEAQSEHESAKVLADHARAVVRTLAKQTRRPIAMGTAYNAKGHHTAQAMNWQLQRTRATLRRLIRSSKGESTEVGARCS